MVIYRKWFETKDDRVWADCYGWFLFGLIPIYVCKEYQIPRKL